MSEAKKLKRTPMKQVGTSAVLCGDSSEKEPPRCDCHGHPQQGYMCGMVTVGGKFCGSKEPCEHKII